MLTHRTCTSASFAFCLGAPLLAALLSAGLLASAQEPQRPEQRAADKPGSPNRQQWASEKLNKSPRRSEWVRIPHANRILKAWIEYPEGKEKAPVVLVLHEVFGLTDSTRNTADEIAAMGYVVITPDMLSGRGPNGGDSDDYSANRIPSTPGSSSLTDAAVTGDLDFWSDFAARLPQSNGKLAIVGVSWGGGAAFHYATTTQRKDLKAIFVFYDVGPPSEAQKYPGAPATVSPASISVPVFGFYPALDTRVMKALPATKEAMAAAGKRFEAVVYEGAEHAYMRVGEDPANQNSANVEAAKDSLARLEKLLKEIF